MEEVVFDQLVVSCVWWSVLTCLCFVVHDRVARVRRAACAQAACMRGPRPRGYFLLLLSLLCPYGCFMQRSTVVHVALGGVFRPGGHLVETFPSVVLITFPFSAPPFPICCELLVRWIQMCVLFFGREAVGVVKSYRRCASMIEGVRTVVPMSRHAKVLLLFLSSKCGESRAFVRCWFMSTHAKALLLAFQP